MNKDLVPDNLYPCIIDCLYIHLTNNNNNNNYITK